jgi:serine phosphatase RsbU (regulator of sigma subunit)
LLLDHRTKPVDEIVETIFDRIAAYSTGEPQSDDISVFIIRYVTSSDQEAETRY